MKQLINDSRIKKDAMKGDKKYSRAIKVPQYTPSNAKPSISEMVNTSKYRNLMAHINNSELPEEEKEFLRLAASRHIVFTFSKIADYYAHSSKEMQELMEESALVILDMNDAIANGYVTMSEKMKQLIQEEKARDKKAREAADVLKRQRKIMRERLDKAGVEEVENQISKQLKDSYTEINEE